MLKSPDFTTPRRSKKHFNTARLQITAQKKKLKLLHQTVRRLRNKLSSVNNLVSHLKAKNLITEQVHDNILVFISNNKYCSPEVIVT